jgi:hypothetical protein
MPSPWHHYDKATAELEDWPIEIKGKTFVFPSQVGANWGLDFTKLMISTDPQATEKMLVMMSDLILHLLGPDEETKLRELATWPQYQGIGDDLLVAYGIAKNADEEEDDSPNSEAPKSGLTLADSSSKTSARSERTSRASTPPSTAKASSKT